MGFFGTYIVTRADQAMAELPALVRSAGEISWHGRGPHGWQAVQISGGPEGWDRNASGLPAPWEATLRALMEQSGHPVLATTILDSDCGQLIGFSPKAGRWGGWLQPEIALDYLDPAVSQGDEGTIWRDENGEIQAMDEELTDEKRERYQRRYDEALARLLTIGPDAEGAAPLAVGS